MQKIVSSKWMKLAVFLVCLVPLGQLGWRALHAKLGANPIEYIEHDTGDWTLIFVVITLAVTPVRKVLRMPDLIRFRRMLGLFTFFYAFLHFSTWVGLDNFFAWPDILHDIHKRPFVTVGFTAFVLMIPLALTSTAGWIRRLGGRRWRALHRLFYATAVLAVIHYYWLVKSNHRKPLFYGALIGLLLTVRVAFSLIGRRRKAAPTAVEPEFTTAETV